MVQKWDSVLGQGTPMPTGPPEPPRPQDSEAQ